MKLCHNDEIPQTLHISFKRTLKSIRASTSTLQNNNACYIYRQEWSIWVNSKIYRNIIHSYAWHTLLLLVHCLSRRKHLSAIISWIFLHLPVKTFCNRLEQTGHYNLSHHFVQASEGQNVSCLYLRKTEPKESDCWTFSHSGDGAFLEVPLSHSPLWIHPVGQKQSCCPRPYLQKSKKRKMKCSYT